MKQVWSIVLFGLASAGCASREHALHPTSTAHDARTSGAPAASASEQPWYEGSSDDVARLVGYFPNTELTTQKGRRVRFYDDLVRDRCLLINFMYTTCEGT